MSSRPVALPQTATLASGNVSTAERWAFRWLVAFVATQGFLIPIAANASVNWAFWPSLPDIFGFCLVLTVVAAQHRFKIQSFNRGILRNLVLIALAMLLNFALVTIPLSSSGEGIKFGGFSVLLFIKFVIVYWAAAHVRLNKQRLRILHIAALVAFLWLTLTTLADRFYLIEIDNFVAHLPAATAGKWNVQGVYTLNSTVSNSHGGTTIVILLLNGLVLGTSPHRSWLLEILVTISSMGTSFITGSRQGLVRVTVFTAIYFSRKPSKLLVMAVLAVVFTFPFWSSWEAALRNNTYFLRAAERQNILATDPFSIEGLAGRPELWIDVIDTLNEDPLRWLLGYGVGNYVEFENASHNMFLRLLQDGGLIELIVVGLLWLGIFRRIWSARRTAWTLSALLIGLLSSIFTSDILAPTLATGWYLGLFFVSIHILTFSSETENSANSR